MVFDLLSLSCLAFAMPINVYTGLQRSGKSYEVVSEVILNAIANGRRVVTNVDGVSNELIREYVAKKFSLTLEVLGTVHHVATEDINDPKFFPYFDDKKGTHTDTVVQPGDLVCIDEAWRVWPESGVKIHPNHRSFLLEHGHFTNEKTGVACDIVLMVQSMGTLNRFVTRVVAFSFRTHKKVSLGFGSVYSLNMWEGSKQTKATLIGTWVRKYNPEIFPLYKSFKDGASGKTVNVDKRQNILASKKLWFLVGGLLIMIPVAVYFVWRFFHPPESKSAIALIAPVAAAPRLTSAADAVTTSRIAGFALLDGVSYVVVVSGSRIRFFHPSMLRGVQPSQFLVADGETIYR